MGELILSSSDSSIENWEPSTWTTRRVLKVQTLEGNLSSGVHLKSLSVDCKWDIWDLRFYLLNWCLVLRIIYMHGAMDISCLLTRLCRAEPCLVFVPCHFLIKTGQATLPHHCHHKMIDQELIKFFYLSGSPPESCSLNISDETLSWNISKNILLNVIYESK